MLRAIILKSSSLFSTVCMPSRIILASLLPDLRNIIGRSSDVALMVLFTLSPHLRRHLMQSIWEDLYPREDLLPTSCITYHT